MECTYTADVLRQYMCLLQPLGVVIRDEVSHRTLLWAVIPRLNCGHVRN